MRRILAVVAVCAFVPAVATAATTTTPVSGKFKGKTSQGDQVTINVVTNQLERSTLKWSATCTAPETSLNGRTFLTGTMAGKYYRHKEIYTVPVKSGLKAKHTATVHFTVTGHRLKGWFKVVAVVFSKPGQVTTTCTTPKITFNARS